MINQTYQNVAHNPNILATFNDILRYYPLEHQKNTLKYFEAMKLRKDKGIGARKISRIVGMPEGAVNYWLWGSKPRCAKGLENLMRMGLLPLTISNKASFKHFIHTLGLRYSDGCIYYQKNNNSYTFYICFGNKVDAMNFVKDTQEILGLDLNVHYSSRAYYVYLPSEISRLAIHLGSPLGNKTQENFRLPKWIFSLPPELKWEFLSGLFSGDGSAPRLKPYGSCSESLKLSLNAKKSSVEKFSNGFMTDLWRLISELGIKVSRPKIEWNRPIISKTNSVTLPINIRILTQKKNMINFLEHISYTYCNRASSKATEVLKVLKGSRQNKKLNSFILNKSSSHPYVSVLLEKKTQKELIMKAANSLSTEQGKFKKLAQYLNKACHSLKEVKQSSVQDVYLPNWKFSRKFIPIDCLMELVKLSGKNFSDIQNKILKVKDFGVANKYAVSYVDELKVEK